MMARIKVSGPGGCISTEMRVIEKALRDAGFQVTVIDDHRPEDNGAAEDWLEKSLERVKLLPDNYQVTLIADHQPWGG